MKYTPCRLCQHCRPDKTASMGKWTAYTCINFDSDFYWALLNVSTQGLRLSRITHKGCELFDEAPETDIATRLLDCQRWREANKDDGRA